MAIDSTHFDVGTTCTAQPFGDRLLRGCRTPVLDGVFVGFTVVNSADPRQATHKVAAADRTLAKAIDSINDCIHLRKSQQPGLHAWLLEEAKP